MTREKANEVLKRSQKIISPISPLYEAIGVALEQLDAGAADINVGDKSISCGRENDLISRQVAIDALDEQIEKCDKSLSLFDISMKDAYAVKVERASLVAFREILEYLPPAEPEHTCVNCGRTANNGGWYADGGTRCPIEEHYALPKDGYCHLWEKRNVTDDDYPERRRTE